MKTAVLTTEGFTLHDIEKPIIGDDEVLVKTLACGVCSGDVFVYQNRAELATSDKRLGHEATGQIEAVGRAVSGFQSGDIVTALAAPAYGDYFVAKTADLVTLPAGIDPIYALGEAIACCVHAANRFGIQPSDKVAIVGCGFMGLICLQLANQQGAGFICAIDPIAERLSMARQFGAETTINPFEIDAAEIVSQYGEFDVVIEATGVQSAVDLCTALVTQHGRIIFVGYHQSNNGLRTVNMQQWNFKAIDVVNGHVRRRNEKVEAMRQGMELMAQGHIVTEPLVTIYPFADIEQAFRDLNGRKPGLFKAVVLMEER